MMKFVRIKLWFGFVLVGMSLLSLIVGVVQRGFSAASLSSMFLLAVGGAIVIDVGPTARGRVPSASATRRRRIMLVGLGLVGGVGLLARLGAGESDRSATHLPSSAGQSVTFTLAGHRATSDALGLELSFGESWPSLMTNSRAEVDMSSPDQTNRVGLLRGGAAGRQPSRMAKDAGRNAAGELLNVLLFHGQTITAPEVPVLTEPAGVMSVAPSRSPETEVFASRVAGSHRGRGWRATNAPGGLVAIDVVRARRF